MYDLYRIPSKAKMAMAADKSILRPCSLILSIEPRMQYDEAIIHTQDILCQWLALQDAGAATWNTISGVCAKIIQTLPQTEQVYFGNHPEYKILIPLLRNGTIEVCRKQDRSALYYCLIRHPYSAPLQAADTGKIFSPVDLLRRYPPIKTQVQSFPISSIADSALQYIMKMSIYPEGRNSYNYIPHNNTTKGAPIIGIYKVEPFVWSPAYLYDKHDAIRKIPSYHENPDALNIARLFVRLHQSATGLGAPLFTYNKRTHALTCRRYTELPIVLTRILLLLNPEQIEKRAFRLPNPGIPFTIEPLQEKQVIAALQRIFSDNTIKIEEK